MSKPYTNLIIQKVLKQLQSISLFLLFLLSFSASAQIVTSKKEAQKKGIYSYTETPAKKAAASKSKDAVVTERPAVIKDAKVVYDNNVVAYEPVKKEPVKKGPNPPSAPKKPAKKNKKAVVLNEETDPEYGIEETQNYLAQQLVNNALEFSGVRYRGGGTTKEGMDCSGMVYATFQIFDITLPRSSADMAAGAGHEIKLTEVKKGDLLFFNNNPKRKRINHVGLVTEVTEDGEIKFIHSSTSQGVMVSSMSEPYNSRTFIQANRVVED